MKQANLPPIPRSLKAPLRDALRALSGVADLSEEALEPVARMVPEPFRHAVRDTLHAMKQATVGDVVSRLDRDRLAAASGFVNGAAEGADACARMMGFAWDYLSARAAVRPHWMFSEAVAATALRKLPSDAVTRPALACRAVLTSAAIGELPAAPVVQAAPGGHTPESLLTAAIVWLLTARADSAEEELRLLDMAAALCRSIPAEPRDPADTDKLNARLRMLAQHL